MKSVCLILLSLVSFSLSACREGGPSKDSAQLDSGVNILGRDSIREFFHEGKWDSRIYYRMLDASLGEAREIVLYDGKLAFPQNSSPSPVDEPKETVLESEESLFFVNANGSGAVIYLSPVVRKYELNNGIKRKIHMIVRKNRFLGKRGLYEPASFLFFEFWKPSPRMVVSEARLYFDTLEAAQKFMDQGSAVDDWVHNDEGYVLGYFETPHRNQVNVTLYRYYIDGKPALKMPGYDNEKLLINRKLGNSKRVIP